MLRKLPILLVISALLLSLSIGFISAQDDEEPIRIGIVTDLSGWLSIYGVETISGFQLGLLHSAGIDPMDYDSIDDALADVRIADRPVELLIYDYGSESAANDAANAAEGVRELVESDFVDIIVGPPNSGAAVQMTELTSPDNYDIIYFPTPAASPSLTGENFNVNTFRICRNTDQDALTFATVADEFGSTYVQLAIDTDFGRGTAQAFQDSLEAQGIEFVGDVIYVPADATDLTQYLQSVLDSGAEVLNPIMAGEISVRFTQQVVELGVLDQMTVVGGTNSNDIIVAAPPIIDSVAYIVYNYALPDTEINDWMVENHIALFNDVPDLFTECSFATAQAVVAGLTATEGDPFPDAMIPALEGLTWEGPKGEYYIRPGDHQTLMPLYVIQFRGNEEVELTEDLTMMLPQYELVAEVSAEETAPPCRLEGEFEERCEMNEMMDE